MIDLQKRSCMVRSIEETPVCRLAHPLSAQGAESIQDFIMISPDLCHVAYIAQTQQTQMVVLDGHPQQEFDEVIKGSLVFSPDSLHLAYVGSKNGQQMVVVDGKAKKGYEGILAGSLVFSADSRRLGYSVQSEGQQMVVIDGRRRRKYQGILAGSLQFSPDGSITPIQPARTVHGWWLRTAGNIKLIRAFRWEP